MDLKVENICGLLIRSKLLSPEEIKAMYQRWLTEAKDPTSMPHFARWLVGNQYLTEYQAALITKGHADDFFLNEYKVLDRLGHGRMAGVYKAAHKLGQVVAIKVLPPSRSKDPQILARFLREARLAMKLKHPNVVRSFQVGEAHGVHYLVMEYLEGETLDEVLQRRKKLPPNEAVRLIHQALTGLQHIHEQGLVHRDLKPANLMLVPARRPGEPDTTLQATVKVLDIGLGRALFDEAGQAGTADTELTGEGVLLGTPDYLAPEQARDPRAIDIRADIYSLGCVLYHALTGQPPFPDTNILNQMVRHANETPRPIRDFNPAVPDGLQQIVNWMMAKDPNQRYPTPERAAQGLQVFLIAGHEQPRTQEEAPQLRRYLTYLETGNDSGNEPNSGMTPPAPVASTAPLSSPVSPKTPPPRPAPRSPPSPAAAQQPGSRKHKRPRHAQAPVARPALPAQATPLALPAGPEDFDVELVGDLPPTAEAVPQKSGGLGLTRRDWMLLGIGAGAVIVAVIVGMTLALAFR